MAENLYGYHLPPNIASHGAEIDRLMGVIHWFMILLFIGWGVFMVYCLIRFRRRPGRAAAHAPIHAGTSKALEIGVALFEAVLLIGFSMPVWSRLKHDFPIEKDATVVRIVAEQFNWNIHYPGRDGKFGKTSPSLMSGSNMIGLDPEDPDGKDDIVTLNKLHIVVNKPVIAHLSSKDVIHGFNIPVLRIKQDTIPGMTVPIWFMAVKPGQEVSGKSDDERAKTGDFEIACAQLCGSNHYRMRGFVYVDTPEQFEKWMQEMEAEKAGQ